MPDVFGMIGRRDSAMESRILQGRGARSIRVLIPDDVTVVGMGDLPESHVSITELSDLANKWPPAVINHMWWRQPELEEIRRAARVQYRKKQPAPCDFCGILIRCDMFRHVARCHLDLAQLWRCPVLWCTAWKGTPQDLMDHVVCASPRPSRRAFARRRPTRVKETPVRIAPCLTLQDPLAAAGAAVLDCHPKALPGAMDVTGTDLAEIPSTSRAGVAAEVPLEREQSFGGGGGTC